MTLEVIPSSSQVKQDDYDLMTPVLTGLENALEIRQEWVEQKRAELARAESALAELNTMGGTGRILSVSVIDVKIMIVARQVRFLRQVVKTMESGYVPIPRFEGELLNFETTGVPLNVLVRINKAVSSGLFNNLHIVRGTSPETGGATGGRRRDPLIVGVLRTHPELVGKGRNVRLIGETLEEHFLVAWWRPEDVRPGDSF